MELDRGVRISGRMVFVASMQLHSSIGRMSDDAVPIGMDSGSMTIASLATPPLRISFVISGVKCSVSRCSFAPIVSGVCHWLEVVRGFGISFPYRYWRDNAYIRDKARFPSATDSPSARQF